MFFNDQFYHQRLVELTRDPTSLEARIWIGVALATQSDPRGAKLLNEHFEQCLRIGEPLYALWSLLALKSHAPLSNLQPLFQRLCPKNVVINPLNILRLLHRDELRSGLLRFVKPRASNLFTFSFVAYNDLFNF